MSPTTRFSPRYDPCGSVAGSALPVGVGGGVPGVVVGRVGRRGTIPGTQAQPSQYPYLTYFQASGPTYGQMKPILEVFMRFLRIGSRIDLE